MSALVSSWFTRPMRVGVNLPWLEYGQDFGASAWRPEGGVARSSGREHMRRTLGALAGAGTGLVRWWLLGDGRCGLRETAAGRVLGLDDRFFEDLDSAIAALHEAGLRAIFVLLDFLWLALPSLVGGVQTGGRRPLVRDDALAAELMETVFAPLATRYGHEPAIEAWDLFNEPEWATLGLGTLDPRRSVSRREMRRFLARLAATFRSRAEQPLTLGSARARWLPFVRSLDLDFHQIHWYERLDPLAALTEPVASRGLGRPLMLGEFPTRGASLAPSRILEIAASAGYSDALAWSWLASDDSTDCPACEGSLRAWAGRPLVAADRA